ncbi:MAG: YHS domain-containing protein [Dehalococcoidia bacterium]|nr:MAG: YHS domain-containing protein [Dehalococcoidia bacterium]
MAKDPVCGRELDEKNWLAQRGKKVAHEGETYYFCGLMCRQKFIINPTKYIEASKDDAPPKRSGNEDL